MKNVLKFVLLMAAALVIAVSGAAVQSARQILVAAPVEPVQNEPPAKLHDDWHNSDALDLSDGAVSSDLEHHPKNAALARLAPLAAGATE